MTTFEKVLSLPANWIQAIAANMNGDFSDEFVLAAQAILAMAEEVD